MKKLFLAGAMALFGAVNAQQNSVKVNPFALLGGSDMVTYERAVGAHSSFGVGAGIGGFKFGDVKYKNIGGTVFYRYYFSQAIRGWYGMGSASYSGGNVKGGVDYELNNREEKVDYNSFGFGAKVGYQWIWNSGFTLDLNAGVGYATFNYDDKADKDLGFKANGVLPALGVALGYSF